jgi:hypothetical protein
MSITRRIFMSGVAAMLSVIRIPGALAREVVQTQKDDLDDYEYCAPIEYLEVGEREDMLGGPATEPGWYLHPECWIGCCKTEGPFPNKEAALEADRIRWERIAKSSRGGGKVDGGTGVLEPF